MSLGSEFKSFILRGSVVDLAVGIIIGGAFGAIVASFLADIVMPLIGAAGGANFSNYFYPLSSSVTATTLEAAREQGPVLAWGNFVTAIANFVLIGFVIFLVVRSINKMRAAPAAAAPAGPGPQEVLLAEIRDLLAGPAATKPAAAAKAAAPAKATAKAKK
jgi:large conductance mechanosensitive channel